MYHKSHAVIRARLRAANLYAIAADVSLDDANKALESKKSFDPSAAILLSSLALGLALTFVKLCSPSM